MIQILHALILSPRKILRCFSTNKHLLGTNLSHLWKVGIIFSNQRLGKTLKILTLHLIQPQRKKYLGNHRRTRDEPWKLQLLCFAGFWVLKTPGFGYKLQQPFGRLVGYSLGLFDLKKPPEKFESYKSSQHKAPFQMSQGLNSLY